MSASKTKAYTVTNVKYPYTGSNTVIELLTRKNDGKKGKGFSLSYKYYGAENFYRLNNAKCHCHISLDTNTLIIFDFYEEDKEPLPRHTFTFEKESDFSKIQQFINDSEPHLKRSSVSPGGLELRIRL